MHGFKPLACHAFASMHGVLDGTRQWLVLYGGHGQLPLLVLQDQVGLLSRTCGRRLLNSSLAMIDEGL